MALDWLPICPALLLRPRRLSGTVVVAPPDGTGGVAPALAWTPTYPAALRRPPAGPPQSWKTEPLSPAFPLVALAWAAHYPDRVSRIVVWVAAQPQGSVGPVSPIAAVVVPPLAWAPDYPAYVLRPLAGSRPPASGTLDTFPRPVGLLVPLAWAPTYPDAFAALEGRETLVILASDTAAPSPFVAAAYTPTWLPQLPTDARAPLVIVPPTVMVDPVPPTTFADAYPVIIASAVAVTQPRAIGTIVRGEQQ